VRKGIIKDESAITAPQILPHLEERGLAGVALAALVAINGKNNSLNLIE